MLVKHNGKKPDFSAARISPKTPDRKFLYFRLATSVPLSLPSSSPLGTGRNSLPMSLPSSLISWIRETINALPPPLLAKAQKILSILC
jgi:hypothetical protein